VDATRTSNYQGGCIVKCRADEILIELSLVRAFCRRDPCVSCVGSGEVECRADLEKHGGRLVVVGRRSSQIVDWWNS
jgi:hypothetical protein